MGLITKAIGGIVKGAYRGVVNTKNRIRNTREEMMLPQMQAEAYRFGRGSYAWDKYVDYISSKTPVQGSYKDYITQADAYVKKAEGVPAEKAGERMQHYLAADVYYKVAKKARVNDAKMGVIGFYNNTRKAFSGLEKAAAAAAVVLFALGSLFIYPSITGNVIGGDSKFNIIGIVLLVFTILLCVFGILRNRR